MKNFHSKRQYLLLTLAFVFALTLPVTAQNSTPPPEMRKLKPIKVDEVRKIASVKDLNDEDIRQLSPEEQKGLGYYYQEVFSRSRQGGWDIKTAEFHYLTIFPLAYDSLFVFANYLLTAEKGGNPQAMLHIEKLPHTFKYLRSISVTQPEVIIEDHGEWEDMTLKIKFDLDKMTEKYPAIGHTFRSRLRHAQIEVTDHHGYNLWGCYFKGPDLVILKQLRDKEGRFVPATPDWKPALLGDRIQRLSLDEVSKGFDFWVKMKALLDVRLFRVLKVLRVEAESFDIHVHYQNRPEEMLLSAELPRVKVADCRLGYFPSRTVKNAVEHMQDHTFGRIQFWPVALEEHRYTIMRSGITTDVYQDWLVSTAVRTYSHLGKMILGDMTKPIGDLMTAVRKDIEFYKAKKERAASQTKAEPPNSR